jgi:DNA uptake protein ComE-like DNA-binding protein
MTSMTSMICRRPFPFIPSMLTLTFALAAALTFFQGASADVGQGLLDPNVASEAELNALPHMTPAIVKALMERRPLASATELNAFLLEQKLTQPQANDVYARAFIHVNLNTGTRDEIMLIPGAGARMAREFAEYRPWKTWAQFDREIGKYVGQAETNRFKQYVFIPINLNTATDEEILSIPGAGRRMAREFKEYRPWKTREQFDREIGKYVGPKETARLWRYVVIE